MKRKSSVHYILRIFTSHMTLCSLIGKTNWLQKIVTVYFQPINTVCRQNAEGFNCKPCSNTGLQGDKGSKQVRLGYQALWTEIYLTIFRCRLLLLCFQPRSICIFNTMCVHACMHTNLCEKANSSKTNHLQDETKICRH